MFAPMSLHHFKKQSSTYCYKNQSELVKKLESIRSSLLGESLRTRAFASWHQNVALRPASNFALHRRRCARITAPWSRRSAPLPSPQVAPPPPSVSKPPPRSAPPSLFGVSSPACDLRQSRRQRAALPLGRMPAHTPMGAKGPKGEAELASLRRGSRRQRIRPRRDGEGAGWKVVDLRTGIVAPRLGVSTRQTRVINRLNP